MRLPFFRSKSSKEEREQQAARDFEAAMAKAAPPSDAERTWSGPEADSDWRARAESLHSSAEPERATQAAADEALSDQAGAEEDLASEAPEQSEPDLYGIGVVDEAERERYEMGVVGEDEPAVGEPAPAKPRSTRPRAATGAKSNGSSARRPRSAPSRRATPSGRSPKSGNNRSRSRQA